MTFDLIKEPLSKIINGEIINLEESSSSCEAARILDSKSCIDLLCVRQEGVCGIASRSSSATKYPPSITLRNSILGSYANAEINKLSTAIKSASSGEPIIFPKYFFYARHQEENGVKELYDFVSLDTRELINFIFSPSGFNLAAHRQQYEKTKNAVYVDPTHKSLGGIRFEKNHKTTFVYLSLVYLEMSGIKYQYKKIVKKEVDP